MRIHELDRLGYPELMGQREPESQAGITVTAGKYPALWGDHLVFCPWVSATSQLGAGVKMGVTHMSAWINV